jgi:uncharacterized membrane protein
MVLILNLPKNGMRYLLIALIMLVLDSIFIGLQMSYFKKLYNKIQGSPLKIRVESVILCYVLLVFVLYYFVLSKKRSILDAFLLGICVYGVYDTTTYALLTNYPLSVALTDILWGGILFATTAFIYYKMI